MKKLWNKIISWVNRYLDRSTPLAPPTNGEPVDPPFIPTIYNARSWWRNADKDFYGMNASSPLMPAYNRERIHQWREGTTHEPLLAYNERDGNHPIPLYRDRFAGDLDMSVVSDVRDYIHSRIEGGKEVDLWFETDDSPGSDNAPLADKLTHIDNCVRWLVINGVTMVTMDLESNEDRTYRHDDNLRKAVSHARKRLKEKFPHRTIPIAVHFGRSDANRAIRVGADILHGQGAPNWSPEKVGQHVREQVAVMHAAGKKFIAFEFSHNNDQTAAEKKRKAALAAGAAGTGF